ncbi:MAG: phosphoribosylglycinamide formyltransferase [Gammaproteobacteria bacterium]|nr:MAG: phosphoribosylglycinamide formyltransferase [Gammaproteobacteria bacterium]
MTTDLSRHSSRPKKSFVVLASGSGSNFQTLIDAVENANIDAVIRALVVDRPCYATCRAADHRINYVELWRKNDVAFNVNLLTHICQNTDLIVCAGYLSIIHADVIAQFKRKIINIHPALLPKFGGAGMYGIRVHQAVIAAGESQSGCTVHYVDDGIDTGDIIAQRKVNVTPDDTADSLQQKVLVQEHQLLPAVVKQLLEQ